MKYIRPRKIVFISAVSLLSVLFAFLVSFGIIIQFRKDKTSQQLSPIAIPIANPTEFAVDKWDGTTISTEEEWTTLVNYGKRGNDVYTITDSASFMYFVNDVNSGNTYEGVKVYLNKGIDLNNREINSIGNTEHPFKGTFDGAYYTIYNAKINGDGLFGATDGATIKNVGIYNVSILGTDYVGGIVGTATNTNIENTYVRLGNISGTNVGGLVGQFISNNGVHTISNSFTDTTLTGVGLVHTISTNNDYANRVILSNCYYTVDNAVEVVDNNLNCIKTNLDKASSIDFSSWDYEPDYTKITFKLDKSDNTWTDYTHIEDTDLLSFNYPILARFNKVFRVGSCYENTIRIGDTYADAENLSSAFAEVQDAEAEINILVEKIEMDKTAEIDGTSSVVLDSAVDTTIIRATGDALIKSTELSSLIIGSENGKQITIDGNRSYFEEHNLTSEAAIVSNGYDFYAYSGLTVKDNINNGQGYGGGICLIYPYVENYTSTDEVSAVGLNGITVTNCESLHDGGGIYLGGTFVNYECGIGANVSHCTAHGNGGGLALVGDNSSNNSYLKTFVGSKVKNVNISSRNTINGDWCNISNSNYTEYAEVGIYRCYCDGDGGGLYAYNKSSINFGGLTIHECGASGLGGGAFLGSVTSEGVSNNNKLQIYLCSAGYKLMENKNNTNYLLYWGKNTGKIGGGIYLNYSTMILGHDSYIVDCFTNSGMGAGVGMYQSTLTSSAWAISYNGTRSSISRAKSETNNIGNGTMTATTTKGAAIYATNSTIYCNSSTSASHSESSNYLTQQHFNYDYRNTSYGLMQSNTSSDNYPIYLKNSLIEVGTQGEPIATSTSTGSTSPDVYIEDTEDPSPGIDFIFYEASRTIKNVKIGNGASGGLNKVKIENLTTGSNSDIYLSSLSGYRCSVDAANISGALSGYLGNVKAITLNQNGYLKDFDAAFYGSNIINCSSKQYYYDGNGLNYSNVIGVLPRSSDSNNSVTSSLQSACDLSASEKIKRVTFSSDNDNNYYYVLTQEITVTFNVASYSTKNPSQNTPTSTTFDSAKNLTVDLSSDKTTVSYSINGLSVSYTANTSGTHGNHSYYCSNTIKNNNAYISSDTSITPTFTRKSYIVAVDVSVAPAGNGNENLPEISKDALNNNKKIYGGSSNAISTYVTAKAITGYKFKHWEINGSGEYQDGYEITPEDFIGDSSYVINGTNTITFTAVYEAINNTFTISELSGVYNNTSIQFKITESAALPNPSNVDAEHYSFADWGIVVNGLSSYSTDVYQLNATNNGGIFVNFANTKGKTDNDLGTITLYSGDENISIIFKVSGKIYEQGHSDDDNTTDEFVTCYKISHIMAGSYIGVSESADHTFNSSNANGTNGSNEFVGIRALFNNTYSYEIDDQFPS